MCWYTIRYHIHLPPYRRKTNNLWWMCWVLVVRVFATHNFLWFCWISFFPAYCSSAFHVLKKTLLFSCSSFASTSLVFTTFACAQHFLFSPPYGQRSDDVRLKLSLKLIHCQVLLLSFRPYFFVQVCFAISLCRNLHVLSVIKPIWAVSVVLSLDNFNVGLRNPTSVVVRTETSRVFFLFAN